LPKNRADRVDPRRARSSSSQKGERSQTMRFLITTQPSSDDTPRPTHDIDDDLIRAYMTFNEDMTKAGVLVTAEGLTPAGARARVVVKGGKRQVVDGPFTESKEIVGGYAIIDAKSREEALGLARRFMELHQKHWPTFEGECEVRPFEEEVQPPTH
jgi:hypothetical protein